MMGIDEITEARALVVRTRAKLILKGTGGKDCNFYEADGWLTNEEVFNIQTELGFSPLAYDTFRIKHTMDPILHSKKTTWRSAGSCD